MRIKSSRLLLPLITIWAYCVCQCAEVTAQERPVAEITFKQKLPFPGTFNDAGSRANAAGVAYSSDGKQLAINWEKQVFCFETATWKQSHVFDFDGDCHSVQFTPDNKELVVFLYYQKASPVFSLKTGKQLTAIPFPDKAREMQLHPSLRGSYFYCLSVQKIGQSAAGVVFHNGVRKRDIGCALPNNTLDFYSSAVSPGKGDYLAVSTDTRVLIINTKRMAIAHDIAFSKKWPQLVRDGRTLNPALTMVFSPDAQKLAAGYVAGPGRVFATKTGEVLKGHDEDDSLRFDPVGFSSNSRFLAVTMSTSRIGQYHLGIVDTETGNLVAQTKSPIENLGNVALSPDGQQLVVSLTGQRETQLWSVPDLAN